jgi:hypothetical protein
MQHEGRFRRSNSNLDAVLLSFPRSTIVFERASAMNAVKPEIWNRLFFLPWFDLERSYPNYPYGKLADRIENIRIYLEEMEKIAIYSW